LVDAGAITTSSVVPVVRLLDRPRRRHVPVSLLDDPASEGRRLLLVRNVVLLDVAVEGV
jgi:hypothetical protein